MPTPLALAPDTLVDGRYRIVQLIADGGMGTVFLAEHVLIKRRVALKLLHAELASDKGMVQRFMNEALAAGTLGHPHIVESTDMGFTPDGVPFIVFEYLEGALLTEEIYRTGGMSVRRALRIARQIASALEAAHNANIVHLDLKSDNVFVTDKDGASDHVKVLDFGISRFMELEDRTERGLVIGTPQFMAPEQVEAPDTVDKRADIYALGVVLYEMLTARRPFDGTDPRILLYRICNEEPPPLGVAVPPALEHLLFEKLLAKDRTRRPQSMQEVLDALGDILDSLRGSDSLAPAIATVELPRTPTPVRRRWGRVWLAGAVLAGAAAGALWFAKQQVTTSKTDAAEAALRVDADKLATLLASEARMARSRIETIASTPVIRMAIETDAATVHDMATTEAFVAPAPHETLELFQRRDSELTTLVRLPATAASLSSVAAEAPRAQLVADPSGAVRLTVSEPVQLQRGGIGGAVALSVPVSLDLVRRLLAQDALAVRLDGLDAPVDLVSATDTTTSRQVVVPVPVDANLVAAPLQLVASVRDAPRGGRTFETASFASAGASGVFMLLFGVSIVVGRRRRD